MTIRRNILRRNLQGELSKIPDAHLMRLIWAMDGTQSKNRQHAQQYLVCPDEVITTDISSKALVFKWELETIVNLALLTPKNFSYVGFDQNNTFAHFAVIARIVSKIRKLENLEAGSYLKNVGIRTELHRIAQRQFPWQRGYFQSPLFYRCVFLYGATNCNEYFYKKHGLTVAQFVYAGFIIYTLAGKQPFNDFSLVVDSNIVNMSNLLTSLNICCLPISRARSETANLYSSTCNNLDAEPAIAYLPSLLRSKPIITFGGDSTYWIAPLPEMVAQRFTAGIYYDLVTGPSHLRNEISDRFEEYCLRITKALHSQLRLQRSYKYNISRREIDSPDLIILGSNNRRIFIECKSTKMTFLAQYSEDPIASAEAKYLELAKGIFQIWRYVAHLRLSYTVLDPSPSAMYGMVLSVDMWFAMSEDLQVEIRRRAEMLAQGDPSVETQDMITVSFCSIAEYETVLSRTTEEGLFDTLENARQKKFQGWMLENVQQDTTRAIEKKKYPFSLSDVIPEWSRIENLVDNRKKGEFSDFEAYFE